MSKYNAEGSPLEMGRQLAQETSLIQAHEPVFTTLGALVAETGLTSLSADTKVRVQRFETPTHNVYSASFPDVYLIGSEVGDVFHQARGDFSPDEFPPYNRNPHILTHHWELFANEPKDGPLYQLHERLVGEDHLKVFMEQELPLLWEAVAASSKYGTLMFYADKFIDRKFAKGNLLAVTDQLQQNLPWYYTALGGLLYGIARYSDDPAIAPLREAIGSVARNFPTIDSDDYRWRGVEEGHEGAQERMARFAREAIIRIAEDSQLVNQLFAETDRYSPHSTPALFFTDSQKIYPIDPSSEPYEIYQGSSWQPAMRYLGDGVIALEFEGAYALVKLNYLNNTVVADSMKESSGISPWLLWAEDKIIGEMSLILGDIPSGIKDGVNARAGRSLGILFAAVTLPDEVRLQLIPPEVANRETEDFFVPLIAQTHALGIIQHSPFAQAVKALALSAA